MRWINKKAQSTNLVEKDNAESIGFQSSERKSIYVLGYLLSCCMKATVEFVILG